MTPLPTIETIPIENIRRDAALVGRGYFALAFLPLFYLLPLLSPIVRQFPQVDWQLIANPMIWILLAAAVVFLLAGRSATKFTRGSLWFLIASAIVLTVGVFSAGIAMVAEQGLLDRIVELPAAGLLALAVVGAIAALIAGYTLVFPALAAARLLRTRTGASDATLPAAMAATDSMRGDGAASSRTARDRWFTFMYSAIAVIVGLAGTAVVLWLFAADRGWEGLLVEFPVIYAVIVLWRRGQRYAAVDAADVLKRDTRAPILYLRSFQDDSELLEAEWDIVLARKGADGAGIRKPGLLPRLSRLTTGWLSTSGRLEEVIAGECRSIGPFVGIGAPDEKLPELGASRAYFTDEKWQGAIVRWVDMAQLIVKAAGPTQWIRWELDTITDRGAHDKLIILMPPGDAADRELRWGNIGAALSDTHWHAAMQSLDPQRVVALSFRDGGGLTVVTGGKGRMLDYLIALRLLLYRKLGAGVARSIGGNQPKSIPGDKGVAPAQL